MGPDKIWGMELSTERGLKQFVVEAGAKFDEEPESWGGTQDPSSYYET